MLGLKFYLCVCLPQVLYTLCRPARRGSPPCYWTPPPWPSAPLTRPGCSAPWRPGPSSGSAGSSFRRPWGGAPRPGTGSWCHCPNLGLLTWKCACLFILESKYPNLQIVNTLGADWSCGEPKHKHTTFFLVVEPLRGGVKPPEPRGNPILFINFTGGPGGIWPLVVEPLQ